MKNKCSKIPSSDGWTYRVNKRLKWYGEADDKKKLIQVNPKKGDLINTIVHEELHRKNWKLTEKEVDKKAKEEEQKLSIAKAIKLLKKYKK